MDNHHFKCATTVRGRKLLAKRVVRGVYRKRGKSLKPGHVKPNPKLRQSTGVKGFLKAGGACLVLNQGGWEAKLQTEVSGHSLPEARGPKTAWGETVSITFCLFPWVVQGG